MSSISSSTSLAKKVTGQPSLGQRTGLGFVWMVLQTLIIKVVSVGAQILLARLLLPEAWGMVGLANSVAAFPSLIRDAGLQQILVQRHAHFRRWAGPVFWMSLVLGLASGLILAIAAPVAAYAYKAPQLAGLILLLAIASPINALATVPASGVMADLRYRFQTTLGFVLALFTTFLNVLLAKLGFGAYSFVLPQLLSSIARTVILWIYAPEKISRHLQIRRWRYLVGDSGILLAAQVLGMLVSNGDYLTLGLFRSADIVGLFFFAFNLSLQTVSLLTVNLGSILFPALNKLQSDQPRQIEAFLRATRVFAALSIPLCMLQAAMSDAGMRLLFKSQWFPAIPVLQILSVAMAFRTVAMPAMSLAAAQNRVRFSLVFNTISGAAFVGAVALGAWLGKTNAARTVAISELIFFAISDPFFIYWLMRLNGRTLGAVLKIYITPLLLGGVAASCGNLMSRLVPETRWHSGFYVVRLLIIGLVTVALYPLLLRIFAKKLFDEVAIRIPVFRAKAAAQSSIEPATAPASASNFDDGHS